ATHCLSIPFLLVFFHAPATPDIYTLSLHDALPISPRRHSPRAGCADGPAGRTRLRRSRRGRRPPASRAPRQRNRVRPAGPSAQRSEEHTSELQSRGHLVCRLLLEKKKKHRIQTLAF